MLMMQCSQVSKLQVVPLFGVSVCYRFILRNYIAQNAIEKAEKGDFTEVLYY